MTREEEIKLKLFEIIANNSQNLCETHKFMNPENVAYHVEIVYNELFRQIKS